MFEAEHKFRTLEERVDEHDLEIAVVKGELFAQEKRIRKVEALEENMSSLTKAQKNSGICLETFNASWMNS